ncbi:tetraacyldisaccharide 4'-kinase [Leptospira idonii]|uniref:tetraacyldisaccharide 4'-kinase n=1 Tax=Leptospira idonii TaxID=1193500 RepID=UPI001FE46571|nr:tetraacyldisaccharide 4'-kinase [Leptospira idonii]
MNFILRSVLRILSPFSFLYQFLFFLDRTLTKSKRIDGALVISVGNLTVGGTGKTPFVQHLVSYIRDNHKDYSITILSRGYKASLSETGAKLEESSLPSEVGDEPKLHKETFPDVQVIIGRNRFDSFYKFNSVPKGKKHILLLDDGFQHHKIERDFDFVLLDANRPLGNGYTIPLGILREPLSSLKRADAVLFTKITEATRKEVTLLGEVISSRFPGLPVLHSRFSAKLNPSEVSADSFLVVTGVGNPEFVRKTAVSLLPGKKIETKFFPDHHHYSQEEMISLLSDIKPNQGLVTTGKDWIKWKEFPSFLEKIKELNVSLFLISLEVEMEEKERFRILLESLFSNYEAKISRGENRL